MLFRTRCGDGFESDEIQGFIQFKAPPTLADKPNLDLLLNYSYSRLRTPIVKFQEPARTDLVSISKGGREGSQMLGTTHDLNSYLYLLRFSGPMNKPIF